MPHHSDDPNTSPIPDAIRRALDKPLIGSTGDHPSGQINQYDEGAVQFAVGVRDGKVCLDFGQEVAWLGMSPTDALSLAESLIKHAKDAARGTGTILTLNL